jgi:hypothetical protein
MIQAHFWPANPVNFQNIYDSLKISMQIRFVYSLNSFDSLQIPRHLQVSALRLFAVLPTQLFFANLYLNLQIVSKPQFFPRFSILSQIIIFSLSSEISPKLLIRS